MPLPAHAVRQHKGDVSTERMLQDRPLRTVRNVPYSITSVKPTYQLLLCVHTIYIYIHTPEAVFLRSDVLFLCSRPLSSGLSKLTSKTYPLLRFLGPRSRLNHRRLPKAFGAQHSIKQTHFSARTRNYRHDPARSQ